MRTMLSHHNEGLNAQIWLCNLELTYHPDGDCVAGLRDGSFNIRKGTFS